MWINCKVIGRHHTLVMKWSFHSVQLNFIEGLITNNIYHVFSPFFQKLKSSGSMTREQLLLLRTALHVYSGLKVKAVWPERSHVYITCGSPFSRFIWSNGHVTDTLPMSAINVKRIGEHLSVSSRGRLLRELRGRVPAEGAKATTWFLNWFHFFIVIKKKQKKSILYKLTVC